MGNDDDLLAWARSRRLPPPTLAESRALVARAERRASPAWWLFAAPVGSLGLAAALALVVGLWAWTPPAPPDPPRLPELAVTPLPAPPAPLRTGEHDLGGGDHVVVDGEVEVQRAGDDVVLVLRAGQVVVDAAPRAEGATLVVRADTDEVVVVGTRFTVSRDPFAVAVERGIVEVRSGAERSRLRAGEVWPRPRARPAFAADVVRGWVVAGDLERARAALVEHLADAPGDVASWKLLATVERRLGQAGDAVAAWREVIARGSAADAQRARFEAATLLADRPADAIPLWVAFLAEPDPLAAEARLRLGDARAATGDLAGAEQEWERVIREHPGSSAADQARTRP